MAFGETFGLPRVTPSVMNRLNQSTKVLVAWISPVLCLGCAASRGAHSTRKLLQAHRHLCSH